MNDLKKQLELLQAQGELLLIAFEKEMDQIQKSMKRLTMILYSLLTIIILISLAGYFALQFPKPFLNFWTLMAAKTAIMWTVMFALTKILETWKKDRESTRLWKRDMKQRNDRERQLEEDELMRRKIELKKERLVN